MVDTLLLRALGAFLIANSHLEAFYPWRQLAADGLLGDTLFFFLSGYGLLLSLRKPSGTPGFLAWYHRRLARIVPAVLTVVFLFNFLATGGWQTWTLRDYLANFAIATPYPFVAQLLVCYVAFYFLVRLGSRAVFPITFFALFAPALLLPLIWGSDHVGAFHGFHWVFYFQAMLLGAWVADRPKLAPPGTRRTLASVAGLTALYVLVRLGVAAGPLRTWYFLPHLLVLPLIVLLLRLARSNALAATLQRFPRLEQGVAFVGGLTLEVYLMHYQVLELAWVRSLVFPLNVLVFFGLSLVAAATLARVLNWMQDGRSLVVRPPINPGSQARPATQPRARAFAGPR
jgi:peptidoglycan/LPS O-acetylase OafA/YrhL